MRRRHLRAPRRVVATDFGHVIVLVDYRTGRVNILHGGPAHWWAELCLTGDRETTVCLDREREQEVADALVSRGWLVRTWRARPWPAPISGPEWRPSWGSRETTVELYDGPKQPRAVNVLAAVALAAVMARLGPAGRATRLARAIRLVVFATRFARRDAEPDHIERIVHAVRRIGATLPGSVTALEESTAAVVALAFTGRRTTWCLGVATDPNRFHTWLHDPAGEPVAEPVDLTPFALLRTIPVENWDD